MTIRNLNEYRNLFSEIVYIYVHIPIHYFYMSYILLLHYFTVYIYICIDMVLLYVFPKGAVRLI